MALYSAAMDRDENRQVITSNKAFLAKATWTYVNTTTGAVGAHTLFTVTGDVLVTVFGCCTTNIAGAGTVEVGVVGNTAQIIAQIADATTIDANMGISTYDVPEIATEFDLSASSVFIINNGLDIIKTIGTTALTAGVINWYCLWRPLSDDGSVVAATPA